MSGRKGLGVKADDLIDLLKVKSIERIKANNPEFDSEMVDRIAEQVTIGALRYFLLKFNKNKVIAFDFNEALNFEGDTGPYIQYAIVRCNSIFRKLAVAGIFSGIDQTNIGTIFVFDKIKENEEADFTWDFIFNLSRYNEILEQAFNSLDLSLIASWAYEVSQKFNSYYHKYSILNEKDTELQKARIFIIHIFKTIMEGIAGIMGLPVPEIM
jgi:arginyl-tRNA synthetase